MFNRGERQTAEHLNKLTAKASRQNNVFNSFSSDIGTTQRKFYHDNTNLIVIKNNSGSNLNQYNILSITGSLYDPQTHPEKYRSYKFFTGETPTETGKMFAVLMQSSPAGVETWAIIEGKVSLQINVIDESHEYVDVTVGDSSILSSAESGYGKILTKESGTGTKWAVVLLGAGGGGGGSSATRGIVIVSPTFQDPEAAIGTTEYAGSGYYIVRPDGQSYTPWDDTGETAYTEGQQVTDEFDNRVYTRTAESMTNQAIAPHLNIADWTISEEIKIEYANSQYNRTTETGKPIKDCVPIFSVGSSVKYTSFTKQDTTVIYLLDETVSYCNTPELRTISMDADGAIQAVFQ